MDVCVLGRIGYDLYAVERDRPLPAVEHFSRHLGGSSANIAVGLARLGLRVGIISCLGRDLLADYLLDFLCREGVDTQFVRLVEGYNTSLCLTEVCPPEGFRQVFYRCGAADTRVELGSAERSYLRKARHFITNGTSLSSPPAREATLEALALARDAGAETVFDIDYRASSWSDPAEARHWGRAALPCVDILLGNEDELELLTGQREPQAQVEAALSGGVHLLVRKLGAAGVEAHSREQSWMASPHPGRVVCAIGAGDGFAAGFLYARTRRLPMADCLSYGNAAAAWVVSRVSCADAMPHREELEEAVRAARQMG